MSTNVDELGIEPEDDLGMEPDEPAAVSELGIEPEAEPLADVPAGPAQPAAVETAAPLMEILPADFPLPALIRFVPDPKLRTEADEAAKYALSLTVSGAEGIQKADVALAVVRQKVKAIEDSFEEPKGLAHQLHSGITTTLREWVSPSKEALETVGRRVYNETQRLKREEEEARRKAQEEENRRVREEARRRAEEAAKAKAPAAVVENLQKQAETAQAPPVSTGRLFTGSGGLLQNTTLAKKWTTTIAGTAREAENQQPDTEEMTEAQLAQFKALLQGILEGRDPVAAATPNWKFLDKRAKADEATFKITGVEAYDAGGTRAKPNRRK